MNRAVLEFSSRAENVAFARVAVAAFVAHLKFTLSDLEEIKVAISEAVSNAIVHGYDHEPDRTVQVVVTVAGDDMEVEVIDQGRGILDVKKAMEPTYTTDPERMGLGFAFMQSFMDQLDVQSTPQQGTRIKMSRRAGVPRRAPILPQ